MVDWNKPFTSTSVPAATAPSNVFFDPNSTYGAVKSWNTTPLAGQIREQAPQLAYSQYGQQQGIADNDSAFSRWFYQQYPRFQRGYGQATLENPLITMDQFMKTLPSLAALQAQFQQLSAGQRGENNAQFAPVARWLGR